MRRFSAIVCMGLLALAISSAWAANLNVGPTRTYTRIQDAINVAQPGDVILVDSGTYVGRNGTMLFDGPSNITVKGNGPTRPILDMGPDHSVSVWGKGICTVTGRSSNIKFDGLEFVNGAARDVPPWNDNSHNGAGIRWDGAGLCHVNNCSIHDCEDGMLITTTMGADIFIENSVFHNNGSTLAANGTHNIYAGGGGEGGINNFTLQYSWAYNASVVHSVKASAKSVRILYNRLGDEVIDAATFTWGGGHGNAIDIPKGGMAYIIGNMITKGAPASDSDGNVLRYGEEGIFTSYSKQAYILYNTFNGERSTGQNNFITIAPGTVGNLTLPAVVANNIFYQSNPSDVLFVGGSPIDPNFVDFNLATWSSSVPHYWGGLVAPACQYLPPVTNFTLDYHLVGATESASAVGQALLPGTGGLPLTGADGFSLKPTKNFPNSPAGNPTLVGQNRSNYLDYGAYALNNISTINQPPVVTAGSSLPPMGTTFANRVVAKTGALLMGTVTDDGLPTGTLTYTWSKVTGPGTVTFNPASALITTADFSATGTYTLQLQASDGSLSGTATCTVYVEDFSVDAGANQAIAVGATANLAGTSTYTGTGTRTYGWSQISGPATVTFGTGAALATTASGFTVAGDYVLQLDANDKALWVRDTVKITVSAANRNPTVDAGTDVDPAYETLNTTLHAAANDPDGDPLTYAWVQTAGKAVTYVGGTNAANLTFTVPLVDTVAEAGLTFQVTVNDGKGGVVSDSVNVRARIIGDVSLDDACDVLDLLMLVDTFGLSTGDPGFDPAADFNKDGAVDVLDLLYLIDGFGRVLT
jgi:hypothetical protein